MRSVARLALLSLLALAACKPAETAAPDAAAPDAEPAPAAAEAPVVGMANPASVACGEAGGESVAYDTPQGAIGVCWFKDGRKCEEWALHRDRKCEPPPADAVIRPGQAAAGT